MFDSILDSIGNTPIIRLNSIHSRVYVKLESRNPGGSIKDRAALFMIKDAEASGSLRKGMTIVEPTSGNTGIGLAMVAAALGYRLKVIMPENMSRERSDIMRAYGAEVIFSPKEKGMKGAVDMADEIASKENAFIPRQFDNPANVMSHYLGTAKEILRDMPDVTHIVAGIGTGGTVTGIGKGMREFAPNVKVIGVEPSESPMISKGIAGAHRIQGIGANFVPENLDMDYLDGVVTVSSDDAIAMMRRLASEEGILAGISSGAAVHAAVDVADTEEGKVLAILPDSGERYMSAGIF